jgi:hypothetical protein
MGTPPQVLVLKDKVQRYLNDAVGRVEIDRDGDFTFQFGSSRIFIRCDALGEEHSVVRFTMLLLIDVPPTPELYRYVATEGSYTFGHLAIGEQDGRATIFYSHSLLGDYLDPEEFHAAVGAMVNTGDDLDNQLKQMFGGRLFHEEPVA